MESSVTKSFIEGVVEECFRQGLSPEEATSVFDAAMLSKQASAAAFPAEIKKSAASDPTEDEKATRQAQTQANASAATTSAYNKFLAQEQWANTHYADGTRREKPLFSDTEVRARAASALAQDRMPSGLQSRIAENARQREDLNRRMAALDPNDTGSRTNYERRMRNLQQQAHGYGRQVDAIQRGVLGGFAMDDANDPTLKYRNYRHRMQDYNNEVARDYERARQIKNNWGWFSWLHPGTWFAPSEEEMNRAQSMQDAMNRVRSERAIMLEQMGAAGAADASRRIQAIGWNGVTHDGYTADNKYRRELLEQNRGLRARYTPGQ